MFRPGDFDVKIAKIWKISASIFDTFWRQNSQKKFIWVYKEVVNLKTSDHRFKGKEVSQVEPCVINDPKKQMGMLIQVDRLLLT